MAGMSPPRCKGLPCLVPARFLGYELQLVPSSIAQCPHMSLAAHQVVRLELKVMGHYTIQRAVHDLLDEVHFGLLHLFCVFVAPSVGEPSV